MEKFEVLKVPIPRRFMNIQIHEGYLYMDTNNSSDMIKIKLKLPKLNKNWIVYSYENIHTKGSKVVLVSYNS